MIIYKCNKCDARWPKGIIKQVHDKVCKNRKDKKVKPKKKRGLRDLQ
jgi:hypothetical protein